MTVLLNILRLALVTLYQANPIYRHFARVAVLVKLLESERTRADILAADLDDAQREAARLRASNVLHVLETSRQYAEIVWLREINTQLYAERQYAQDVKASAMLYKKGAQTGTVWVRDIL